MTSLTAVKEAAVNRRDLRWKKEAAAKKEAEANRHLVAQVAGWKKVAPESLTFSNIHCQKAPADLSCVFVKRFNKYGNPCIFCGGWEEDVF